jgi:hypothetical protein
MLGDASKSERFILTFYVYLQSVAVVRQTNILSVRNNRQWILNESCLVFGRYQFQSLPRPATLIQYSPQPWTSARTEVTSYTYKLQRPPLIIVPPLHNLSYTYLRLLTGRKHQKLILKSELLGFWTSPIFWRRQHFGNWVRFRLQVKVWETLTLLVPVERADLNHFISNGPNGLGVIRPFIWKSEYSAFETPCSILFITMPDDEQSS